VRAGARLLAVLALPLALGACVFSKQPLSPPGSFRADTRMVGNWAPKPDEDGNQHERISVRQRDAYTLEVIYRQFYDDRWHRTDYTATFTNMGDYAALNLGHQTRQYGYVYLIASYSWESDGGLTIWIPDPGALFKDIQGGRLAGRIHEDDTVFGDEEAVLSGSSEQVRRTLAAIPVDELFVWDSGPYYRQ